MNILVLNASPKGKNSATVQTALYLQALHSEHTFTFLPVGQRIKSPFAFRDSAVFRRWWFAITV